MTTKINNRNVTSGLKMKVVVAPAYEAFADEIARLPMLMAEGQGEVVYEGRNRVTRFMVNGKSLMAKQFRRVNVVQQVVYTFFRKTKAERAFIYADEFLKRGIDTPQPVAYMECKEMGLFTIGYFVSEESAGDGCHQLLREVKNYDTRLADAVARQVLLMHSKGVLHGDLNLSNFLCQQTAEGYHFTMIDINRSHFTDGWPTDEQCLKNLMRLTHRRDLYEYLMRSYAHQRGWNEEDTVRQALLLLDRFENKQFRL